MTGLETKWSNQPKTGIADKINDTIKPKGPLKHEFKMELRNYNHKLKN